jgi:hypothetical protein
MSIMSSKLLIANGNSGSGIGTAQALRKPFVTSPTVKSSEVKRDSLGMWQEN